MTHPRPRTPLQFPPGYRPSPAERRLAQAGYSPREVARMTFRSERSIARQLKANHVRSHYVASVCAALCECSVWQFSTLGREEPR